MNLDTRQIFDVLPTRTLLNVLDGWEFHQAELRRGFTSAQWEDSFAHDAWKDAQAFVEIVESILKERGQL